MTEETKPTDASRCCACCVWALFVAAFAFLYYRYSSHWGTEITRLAASSAWLAYAVYVLLGALRGFALIPVTNLVVLAIPIFPPVPLLVLTLVGIVISSASIYAFAGSLRLARVLRAQARAAHGARARGAAPQPDYDRHGVELPADRADGSDLLRLRRHADLVPPVHARRARRRRRDLRDLHLRRQRAARSRQATVRRRRRRSTGRGAACGRGGLRRALRALPRAGRRAHSASLGLAADVRRRASCARSMRARCSRSRCR